MRERESENENERFPFHISTHHCGRSRLRPKSFRVSGWRCSGGNRERPTKLVFYSFFCIARQRPRSRPLQPLREFQKESRHWGWGGGALVRVHPFVSAGLGMFCGSPPPVPPKMQLPAHKVDSFWRSRPLHVFLTLEMPSSAPDSVTLDTGTNREVFLNSLSDYNNALYLITLMEHMVIKHILSIQCDFVFPLIAVSQISITDKHP